MPQNGTEKIFSDKQTTNKVALMFLDLKVLSKGNNGGFRLCKQTRKVQQKMKSTVIKKRKVKYECLWSLKWKNQRTHDVFRGRNARIKVHLNYLKVWKVEKKYG